jgi:hypothetical protein
LDHPKGVAQMPFVLWLSQNWILQRYPPEQKQKDLKIDILNATNIN